MLSSDRPSNMAERGSRTKIFPLRFQFADSDSVIYNHRDVERGALGPRLQDEVANMSHTILCLFHVNVFIFS